LVPPLQEPRDSLQLLVTLKQDSVAPACGVSHMPPYVATPETATSVQCNIPIASNN
jgi:hypothetical protein